MTGLTNIKACVMALLLGLAGRAATRDETSRAVQGRDWTPLDRTLDGHIARLRRKPAPAGEAPCLIRSVRDVSYVFMAEVRPYSATP